MSRSGDNIKKLEQQIKVLEEENDSLSGRLEEMMLLSLIAESFEAIGNETDLLVSVLEKISILKNIPFCACYELKNNEPHCLGHYCSLFIKSDCSENLKFSKELIDEILSESVVELNLSNRKNAILFSQAEKLFKPAEALIITFHSRQVKQGFFIFVNNENDVPLRGQDLLTFHQIIQLVVDKWERISLLRELKKLNNELENRVDQRTRQLSISEEKYRQLFDLANDAIFLWELGSDNKISGCLQMNKAAEEMTGFTMDDLSRLNPFELLSNHYSPDERKAYEAGFVADSYVMKAEFNTKKGIIPMEVHSRMFELQDKQVVYAIVRDISERKAYEQKLIDAHNQAVESEKLKSAFLANMSHEIRTPMNAIVGFSELLNHSEQDPIDVKMYANIIFKNSMHLLNLIDDIVDYSKIEANQVSIVNCTININELISDLSVNMISILHNASKSHIDVLTHTPLPKDKAAMLVDGTRLRQVLSNLINNSIKFTYEGFIELGYELMENKIIQFFVRDTGIGIAKENQQRIFDRFVQVRDSKKLHPGGTGLGLAICSNLIEKMGGALYLESLPGEGTTFFIKLPFCSGE